MKNIFKKLVVLIPFSIIGCQSLGEDIAEIPLGFQNIVSSGLIELKKDEKVTIWTKCDVENANPDYKIKYLIEENFKKITFDSLSFETNESRKIIRASTTENEVIESTYDKKDTTIIEKKYTFEFKNKEFTAPKDGKYSFDFKLTSEPESGSMFDNDFTIILRK